MWPDASIATAAAISALVVGLVFAVECTRGFLVNCWARRWQLIDATIGLVRPSVLPASYNSDIVGRLAQIEDDSHHDHEHDHHVGPRNVFALRTALVIGTSSGYGRAFARLLADDGWSLLLCDDVAPSVEGSEQLDDLVGVLTRRLERGWRGGIWGRTKECPVARKITCTDWADVDAAVSACEAALSRLPSGSLRLVVDASNHWPAKPAFLMQRTAAEVDRLVHARMHFATRLVHAVWPRLVAATATKGNSMHTGGQRAGMLVIAPAAPSTDVKHRASPVHAAAHAALVALASSLRIEAACQGLPVDVLVATPSTPACTAATADPHVDGSRTRDAPSAGHETSRDSAVARASLLLLPTARSATVSPLLTEAFMEHMRSWR